MGQQWQTVKLFLSSTFKGLELQRNQLAHSEKNSSECSNTMFTVLTVFSAAKKQ